MKKQFLLFIEHSWFKWMSIVIGLLFIILLTYGVFLYQSIVENKQAGFSESEQLALQETDISSVDEISRYHGEIFYHVINGKTNNGDSAIAFVPVTDREEYPIVSFLSHDYLSKEDILTIWEDKCNSCQLKGISMAIDTTINENLPLWEIKYINNNGRFVFEYFSMDNGESLSLIPLKRSILGER